MRALVAVSAALALSACATTQVAPVARMHTQDQLNNVALGCGLALGELIQDESEVRLLLLVHDNPSAQQRACVSAWAREQRLKTVFVDSVAFPEG